MEKLIEIVMDPYILWTAIITMIIFRIIDLVNKSKANKRFRPTVPPVDIPSIVNAVKTNMGSGFLSDSEIVSIGQSILKIVSRNEDQKCSHGQCFVYAHKNNTTYIGLPKHCYNPKNSLIILTDYTGVSYEFGWEEVRYSTKFDVAMIPVSNSPLLHLPALCEKGLIRETNQVVSSPIFCITPFNVRGLKVKSGKLLKEERSLLNLFCGEGGDSGSLIVGKCGVVGMQVAVSVVDAKNVLFIDIRRFESLYMALSRNR